MPVGSHCQNQREGAAGQETSGGEETERNCRGQETQRDIQEREGREKGEGLLYHTIKIIS